MKVLFLVPYPLDSAPSQRFRFEQYFYLLREKNYHITVSSFIDEKTWSILYKKGHYFRKATGVIMGFLKRCASLFSAYKYDYIFVHREAAPLGPPFFEWMLSRVLKKRLIYDFDDAIWIPNTSENNRIIRFFKYHQKVQSIIGWSCKVSCGNRFLVQYAQQFNSNVLLNPTTIDTENHHNVVVRLSKEAITIGWTGTHSTLKYLHPLIPVLQELEQKYKFVFCVICNKSPDFKLSSLKYIQWTKQSEIEDLAKFDIGVMPLEEDAWANGKCGFKALQYMSLGIPPVASPVGVNVDIVEQGITGFLCKSKEEWYNALELLIKDENARNDIGSKARKKVENFYSVNSNKDNFIRLFQ